MDSQTLSLLSWSFQSVVETGKYCHLGWLSEQADYWLPAFSSLLILSSAHYAMHHPWGALIKHMFSETLEFRIVMFWAEIDGRTLQNKHEWR